MQREGIHQTPRVDGNRIPERDELRLRSTLISRNQMIHRGERKERRGVD